MGMDTLQDVNDKNQVQNVSDFWRQRLVKFFFSMEPHIYEDLREKGIFEDVNVEFQAHLRLKYDVDVFENAFFLWMITFNNFNNLYNKV